MRKMNTQVGVTSECENVFVPILRRRGTDGDFRGRDLPRGKQARALDDIALEQLIPYIDWTFFFAVSAIGCPNPPPSTGMA